MEIEDVKKELQQNPEIISEILSEYGFCHINIKHNCIKFAEHEDGNKTACNLMLDDPNLFIKDFVRGHSGDIFSFIMKERKISFKEVFALTKDKLGIEFNTVPKKKLQAFGGLCNKIKKKNHPLEYKIYPENTLERYDEGYSDKFLKDHISLRSQDRFGIKYSIQENSIVIPIRSPTGELIGTKFRRNYAVFNEPKYIYDIPCPISQTLFGYAQNYSELYQNDVIVGEAEKFVMQADSYGYRNAVGLGSSSLSITQCKLLLSLCPNSITFMMDIGLSEEIIMRNAEMISLYSSMLNVPVYVWNGTGFNDKESPTDQGKEMFEKALKDRRKINVQCKRNDRERNTTKDIFTTQD